MSFAAVSARRYLIGHRGPSFMRAVDLPVCIPGSDTHVRRRTFNNHAALVDGLGRRVNRYRGSSHAVFRSGLLGHFRTRIQHGRTGRRNALVGGAPGGFIRFSPGRRGGKFCPGPTGSRSADAGWPEPQQSRVDRPANLTPVQASELPQQHIGRIMQRLPAGCSRGTC
jgi:hypothetical protein